MRLAIFLLLCTGGLCSIVFIFDLVVSQGDVGWAMHGVATVLLPSTIPTEYHSYRVPFLPSTIPRKVDQFSVFEIMLYPG